MLSLDSVVGSPFSTLVLSLAVISGLYRLYTRALDRADRAWDLVHEMTVGLKENTSVTTRLVDIVERRAP